MISVGVRELKARLSYYLKLMEAGETIVIKIRDRVAGFLSQFRPPIEKETAKTKKGTKKLMKRLEQLKEEGLILERGTYRHIPFEPIKMTPGPDSTEIIRRMRDEE